MRAVRLQYGLSLILFLLLAEWLLPAVAHSQIGDTVAAERYVIVQAAKLINAHWQELPPSARARSYVLRWTPFYSWLVLCDAVDEQPSGFFLGNCIDEQQTALRLKPVDQFVADYNKVLQRLWAHSPLDAIKFADTFLGYSTHDWEFDNALSFVQLVGVPLAIFLFF